MIKYTGKKLKTPVLLGEIKEQDVNAKLLEKKQAEKTLPPYIPDPDLIEAVNLAIVLKRPLLVMGEPGCGKSVLAEAVAFELFHNTLIKGKPQDYRQWLFKWFIKSTTKAKDGFYEYDALRRLLDVQLSKALPKKNKEDSDPSNPAHYIELRAMAKAIQKSTLYSDKDEQHRAILLIDEIDKADLDFPNDLLSELEGGEHIVPETGKDAFETPEGCVRTQPIIIITSNREKELPDAFLRRCIYYYIPPFKKERLEQILEHRFYPKTVLIGNLKELQDKVEEVTVDPPFESLLTGNTKDLRDKAVEAFIKARTNILEARSGGKNVSTSELIDWFDALKTMSETGVDANQIDTKIGDKVKDIDAFLEKRTKNLPLQQALFKNYETVSLFKNNAVN